MGYMYLENNLCLLIWYHITWYLIKDYTVVTLDHLGICKILSMNQKLCTIEHLKKLHQLYACWVIFRCQRDFLGKKSTLFQVIIPVLIQIRPEISSDLTWIQTFGSAMRGSIKYCQRGSDFDNVFLFVLLLWNTTISVPPSTRQRNAI